VKFLSPHFKSLHVNGVGTFVDGELTVFDGDERAIAKVQAIAEQYSIETAEETTPETTADTPAEESTDDPAELKGAALDDALRAAGLPVSGKADEKRARLAAHRAELTAGDEPVGQAAGQVPANDDVPGPAAAAIAGTTTGTATTPVATAPDVLTSGTVPSPA